jgi:hypothetical protein
LVHHREQLDRQRIEIELLTQAGAEHLDGHGRVVLAPVETPVNRLLDARRAGWNRAATAQLGGSLPTPPRPTAAM